MTDDDRHGWTHPICDDCWWQQEVVWHDDGSLTMRQPTRVGRDPDDSLGGWTQCCRCGGMTTAGIYVRQNPTDEALGYCPDNKVRHRP